MMKMILQLLLHCPQSYYCCKHRGTWNSPNIIFRMASKVGGKIKGKVLLFFFLFTKNYYYYYYYCQYFRFAISWPNVVGMICLILPFTKSNPSNSGVQHLHLKVLILLFINITINISIFSLLLIIIIVFLTLCEPF